MLPFRDDVIVPVLAALEPQRVVEVGALAGETTLLLLEHLPPGAELHVIDPDPQFDASEFERRLPGRCFFHRAPSLDILGGLSSVDVALIDGDHNWFTVSHELALLSAAARQGGTPLPVLVLHDVGWPYGRRDMYHAPEQIPPQFRQPCARRGIVGGQSELALQGGANAMHWNALTEGGARNGVLTALEDFLATYEEPTRVLLLPMAVGLAVVASAERLELAPRLARLLEQLALPEEQERLRTVADDAARGWYGSYLDDLRKAQSFGPDVP